jgi:predicted DNA-binding ribbon-helix-helix protein
MALEPVYWIAIQRLSSGSGLTWKQWTEQQISKAPAGTRNLTSWIRSQVIQELMT